MRNTGFYYYGARYYNPRESLWLSVDPPLINGKYLNREHDGGVYNSFNLGSYLYCRANPVTYIDPDGNQYNNSLLLIPNEFRTLHPRGTGAKPFKIIENYKFNLATAHLLSLVSGESEKNILAAKIEFSTGGFDGASITLGSSPQNATITHYYDNEYSYPETDGSSFYEFFGRNAHEVGHIKQLINGTSGQIKSSLKEYIKNIKSGQDWHKGSYATKEKIAEIGKTVFTEFNKFIDNNYGVNKLQSLFENKNNTQQDIIGRIDQWWSSYQKSKTKK